MSEESARRIAVAAWRWMQNRDKAPTVDELLRRWPEMTTCEHRIVKARTSENDCGTVIHVECRDCPKSAMRLVRKDELIWPGEEFWGLTGRPAWAPSSNT